MKCGECQYECTLLTRIFKENVIMLVCADCFKKLFKIATAE